MNKTAIKNFAIWARNKLIADVSYRAGLLGITDKEIKAPLSQSTKTMQFFDIGTADPYSISGGAIRQRQRLADAIEQKAKADGYTIAYQNMIEEVAYTWFNRLIAIRFMEVNDYMPAHIRVLSSDSGKMEPDIVTTPFDAELEFTSEEQQRVMQLKTDNQIDELFRMLFIKQCNVLNAYLPALFEKTNDYSELLLNLSVIDQEGVVYHLIHDIDEADFNIEMGGQVEIIGWLYQYYNTEPKAAAFAQKEKIRKDQIPAVTQLFTPDWIVRYMVENSLGRLWIEGHPDYENLKSNWKYFLEEAEQEAEVQAQLVEIRKEYAGLNPEDIKLIDPCMGSGHILVYCFDVLMEIYEAAGYSQRDAARSILENNIYGLDIDDRAFQLSYFALMMKARQYNRRILSADTVCHVHSICESNEVNKNQIQYFGADLDPIEKNNALNQMQGLIAVLHDAKEYGSILNVDNYDWDLLRRFVASEESEKQMSFDTFGIEQTQKLLRDLIDVGMILAMKYNVVITNPPYMGISNGNQNLSNYVKKNYPDSKTDLFAVFIERCGKMTAKNYFQAMITQHAWMFLSSFEKLREKFLQIDIVNMAHLGARAFEEIGGEVVQTTSFVVRKTHTLQYKGRYCRLTEPTSQKGKEEIFLLGENFCESIQDNFSKIPGAPIAYWMSENVKYAYSQGVALGSIAAPRKGNSTSDNNRFLRLWFEVHNKKMNLHSKEITIEDSMQRRWYPYNKGGGYRKWYGFNEYLVDWYADAAEIRKIKTAVIANYQYFMKAGLTWSTVSSQNFSIRWFDEGYIFDNGGCCIFELGNKRPYLIALLNSSVFKYIFGQLNPTLNFQSGEVAKFPILFADNEKIDKLALDSVRLSVMDWDSFETSWDFKAHPFIVFKDQDKFYEEDDQGNFTETVNYSLEDTFQNWSHIALRRFEQLKSNEEELNRIFIDIYGLQDELTPEVKDKDVTIRKADLQRDIRSLISYAVGCMFGRYSLDKSGLILAGQPFSEKYVYASVSLTGTGITGNLSSFTYTDGDCYLRLDDGVKQCIFAPDKDNIIPITDEEYFEDDIVGLFCSWLKKVYGEDTLETNLDFIAQALGNKGNTSREIIRNYFLNDFFKDHCKTYSVTGSGKRPIYWLFDSGKQNGFKALIYMHRYDENTIGNLRVNYLHRMERIYDSEIIRMQDIMDNSTVAREVTAATKRKEKLQKQVKECREYDEKIAHLALDRIAIDLDDGVKVNYSKVQTGTDGKFYEVLADSKTIMSKS